MEPATEHIRCAQCRRRGSICKKNEGTEKFILRFPS